MVHGDKSLNLLTFSFLIGCIFSGLSFSNYIYTFSPATVEIKTFEYEWINLA